MITKAKVLSWLVVFIILISVMPISVVASEPMPTKIHLQDATFEWHTNQSLTAKLVDENDVPLSGKEVWFYQKRPDGWQELGSNVTNESGIAEFKIYVIKEDGAYYSKSALKGSEKYLPSSDIAEITVVGVLATGKLAYKACKLAYNIGNLIAGTYSLVDGIYETHQFNIEEVVKKLKEEREDWRNRAPYGHMPPMVNFPELFDKWSKSIYKVNQYNKQKSAGLLLPAMLVYLVEESGISRKSLDEYESDIDLARDLMMEAEELYNEGCEESDDDKKAVGVTAYVAGIDLLLEVLQRLDDLDELQRARVTSGIFDPSAEFSIVVAPSKYYYMPGESAKAEIKVISNKNKEIPFWLGVSFKDKNGAIYDVPDGCITPDPNNVEIAPDTIKKFAAEWAIPDDAPVGEYQIAVNCYKMAPPPDVCPPAYTDDFDWKGLFYVPEYHISASLEKVWYQPDEKVTITIDVENLGEDKNIWFDATLFDPHSELQYPDITPNPDNVLIRGGETKKFKAEWTIPQDAPLGEYSLFINCYKEAPPPDVCPPAYADDFDSKVAFYCYNLEIIAPTSSSPIVVGDPNNPTGFPTKVSTGLPIGLNIPGIFSAKINGKTAKVTVTSSTYDSVNEIYLLQISPPSQDSEGQYALNIAMDIGHGISDCDIKSNAVIYSTGGNADIMLIMDRSGSMTYDMSPTDPRTRMSQAKVAAKSFVDTSIKNEDQVGGVDFAGETNLFLPLTLVQSQSDKDFIVNEIENVNVGDWTGTNIGGPMLDAYNELNSERGIDGNAKASILLTDGGHNTGTHPDDVTPYYKNKNWPVHTIGFGAGDDFDEELLIKIASETGGTYHHAPSTAELQDIYNSIGGTIRGEQVVSSTAGTIHPEQSVLEEVCIDPSVREASFTVNWEGSDIDLVLNRPDGSIVNELVASTDPDITYIEASTYEVYNVNNPSSGKWTMHLAAIDVPSGGEKYNTRVLSATNLTVHVYTDKEEYSPNEPIKIITTLTKAGNPITRADVNATIERPDNVKEHLLLYDDGKHNDGVALDGVYANYYTNTDVSGSYTIDVYASGKTGPDEFTREVTKSVYVSDTSAGQISVTPASWAIGAIHRDEDVISAFRVSSASTVKETVTVSATDLIDDRGNVIGSENLISMPSTFVVPTGESGVFYERIYVPATARAGNYTGSIVLASTANSVSIPVTLNISKSGYVSIKSTNAAVGVSTTTQITINDITNFGVATVTLYYDPSVVHITRVTAGDVGNPIANINNTVGMATIVAYVSTATGHDSPITFANLELLAVGSSGDTSPLTLAVTTLADANGTSVPATISSGIFVVGTGVIKGDLNGDNQITPADAVIALHLAASGGWDPAADVNHITSLDALTILQAAAET